MVSDARATYQEGRFRKVYTTLEDIFCFYLPGFITLFLMIFMCTDICLRWLFNTSIQGIVEIVESGMLVITFASLAGIQRGKGHVRMSLLIDRLSTKKISNCFELFNYIVILGMFICFSYRFGVYTMNLFKNHEISEYVGIPFWSVAIFMPLGSILLCFRLLYQIRDETRKLTGPRDSGLGRGR